MTKTERGGRFRRNDDAYSFLSECVLLLGPAEGMPSHAMPLECSKSFARRMGSLPSLLTWPLR